MARKPRKQWSKAYRRRVERAERKGLSRQAARGHLPREHVSRKQAAGLTPAQSAAINKFAVAQAAKDRHGPDPAAAAAVLKQWAREHGYDRFLELRELVKQRHGETRRRIEVVRPGQAVARISVGQHDLAADYEYFDLPNMPEGDDFAWLFYH